MLRKTITLLLFFAITSQVTHAQKEQIKLEDIWGSPRFFAKAVYGFRSMKDGLRYTNTVTTNREQCIVVYDFKSGKAMDTLVCGNHLIVGKDTVEFSDYQFSMDESKILFSADDEQIYRHSSRSNSYVYDLKTHALKNISSNGKQMYATFSPDGKKVAYVRDNNLYITDVLSGNETTVTTDGKKNEIINGATDWVYEEEFSMDVAFQWAPDGSSIAYYKFDESRVKEFTLTYYGDLYPKEERYKYPKAGEENSKVEIYVYQLAERKTVKMDTGKEREYIPRIKWTQDANTLSVQRTNRHQNELELLLCNATTGASKVILQEKNNSYIDVTDDLTFLSDKKQFIWTSTRDGYNHICLYMMDGSLVKQITRGKHDITKYYGYDEKNKLFYYQTAEPTPTERQINTSDINGKKTLLSPVHGTSDAKFTSTFQYFANVWSGYGTPYRCTVNDAKGKEIRVLEDNDKVKNELAKFDISKVENSVFKKPDGLELYGWTIKPTNFDPAKKYPVLMFVYGGPGKQTVLNHWQGPDYLWHQMLAEKGYIIVSVDNRGTPGRGREFANCIYKDMGKLEVQDQVFVAGELANLPYVDKTRIGIWGWSYGGYMSSLLMTKAPDVFKCGIAVAPVTNWRFYDSIYTERYLQTPQENPKGYDDNSPIFFAKQLKGKFMLVHGGADDNVHVQNSMDFINALVKEKKDFDLMIYPNRAHGISGGGARYHLYNKMTNFVLENL